MIYRFTLFLFAICSTIIANAQWEKAHVSDDKNSSISAITVHKEKLNVFGNGFLYQSNDGLAWDTVGYNGFTTNASTSVRHITTSGPYLYAVTYTTGYGNSMIYRSSDNGKTFEADTSNFPIDYYRRGVMDIHKFYSFNGTLFAIISTGWHYKTFGDSIWRKGTGPNFPESFSYDESTNQVMAWNAYGLELSSDLGQSWTRATSAGLPSRFLAKRMAFNQSTQRLWIGGRVITTEEEMILYTDDFGASWDSIPFSNYQGKSWIGFDQTVVGLYADGATTIFVLDNNAGNTAPDVYTSNNGGASFFMDTVGLGTNYQATAAPNAFASYKGSIYMGMNFYQLYRKNQTVGIDKVGNNRMDISLYPQPASTHLNITSKEEISTVSILNTLGQEIESQPFVNGRINLNQGLKGYYVVKINFRNGESITRPVIFE